MIISDCQPGRLAYGRLWPIALLLLTTLLAAPTADAQSPTTDAPSAEIAIDAQPLENALIELARQTGVGIFVPAELVEGIQAQPLHGTLSMEEALQQLLTGTGLSFQRNHNGGYVVTPPAGVDAGNASDANVAVSLAQSETTDGDPETDPGLNMTGEPTTASVETVRRGGIEEVIVTARKREESVQDVPISITALSTEEMKAFGIRNVADMEGIVPGLNMGGGGNGVKKDSNPFIRGVGQRETKVTLDPGVGTYIDGIYIGRPAGGLIDVATVERVEVLRGPQGTLFGRNVTGGAISITTKKPANDWGAEMGVNVGNYGRSDVTAALNAPIISDTLMSRITVASTNSEGYFTNIVDNTKWGGDNRITAIGQLRWLAAEDLTFDLLVERSRIRETPRPQRCAVARPIDGTGSTVPSRPDYNPDFFYPLPISNADRNNNGRRGNEDPFFLDQCMLSAELPSNQFISDLAVGNDLFDPGRYWVDTSTYGLTGAWDLAEFWGISNAQVKSITAWRRVDAIGDEDLDAVANPNNEADAQLVRVQPDFTKSTQFSQELQLTGSALNDRLFFSTGLYYFSEETPKDDLYRAAGIVQNRNMGTNGQYGGYLTEPTWERLQTDNETYAWYGQVNFDLTTQLQLTAGIRYTQEDRWSRYSKAYAAKDSIIQGNNVGTGSSGPGTICLSTCPVFADAPGLAKVVDWEFGPLVGGELSTKDEAWTPMLSLQYQANAEMLDALHLSDAMVYATYSEGFHSGGVTAGAVDYDLGARLDNLDWVGPVPPNSNPKTPERIEWEAGRVQVPADPGYGAEDPVIFKPEKVKNYEVGLKLQAFERRLQANLAVFYMDYTDMQVTSTGNRGGLPIPFVENVGNSVIQGVEAEFIALPTPEWRVIANFAYTDADMKEWDAQRIQLNAISGAATGVTTERRDDEPMPRVPEWQAFLLTDYTFRLRGGSILSPSISARYTSEIYHGFDRGSFVYGRDVVTSDKVTFIDARIPWTSADGKMEIAAWVKNLTNVDDYLVGGIPLVDVTGAMGQVFANPRTFGLNMTYRFGAM